MPAYFPRQTVQITHFEEPSAFRRLTFSLVEMAVVAGVLLRLYRAFVVSHGSNSLVYILAASVGLVFLLAMLTAHLANFPLVRWTWRAPLFALVEVAAGMATSLVLIAIGREPYGTVRATFADWPALAALALGIHLTAIVLWSLILAAAVTIVRRTVAPESAADEAEEEAIEAAIEARRHHGDVPSGSTAVH